MPNQRLLASGQQIIGSALRTAMPFAVGGGCLWLIAGRVSSEVLLDLGSALATIAPHQWLLALCATAISFWALGRYDVVLHRHFRTKVSARHAGISGAAAIAVSQVLGFGIVTGALVRWRMLPGLSPGAAVRMSLGVALSFLVGLAFCIVATGFVLRPAFLPLELIGALAFALIAGVFLLVGNPVVKAGRYRFRAPSLVGMARITGLTAIDTASAACALYLLMPPDATLGFDGLLPAYLLALGIALVSGTPGGVGPFELVLLSCLPQVPAPALLAAIMAFRLVYFVVPAVIAVVMLWRPLRSGEQPAPHPPRLLTACLPDAPRAELGVCRQNNARLLDTGPSALAIVETAQTITTLFDPLAGDLAPALPALARHASDRNLLACVYKASPRQAAHARASGWYALHMADEAVIDPKSFDPGQRACRQLRRKLRQADRGGLTVTCSETLPLGDMSRIDARWQARSGGARGLSMGRFCPRFLDSQMVFVARTDGHAVGFVSFHTCAREMCLDLVRWSDDAPNGTTHALIVAAIARAHALGIPRLSLAALPPSGDHAAARLVSSALGSGLGQFKLAFAPRRQPLYALAPSRLGLAVALADIALTIRAPDRIRPHNDVEEIAFAPARQT